MEMPFFGSGSAALSLHDGLQGMGNETGNVQQRRRSFFYYIFHILIDLEKRRKHYV